MDVQTTGEVTTTTTAAEPISNDVGGLDMAGAVDSIGADLGFGETVNEEVVESASPEVEAKTEPQTPASTEVETPAPAASATPAPRTWRPEASAEWAKIPPVVQAEILKREEDMFRGLEGYKVDAGLGKSVAAILQPYDSVFKQYNINPVQQLSGLMNTHYRLSFGTQEEKATILSKLAVDYGIAPANEAPYADPQVKALQQELQTLKSGLQGVNQQREAEVRSKLAGELESFAKDPANADFDLVANDIAAILQSGQAGSLREAYDKAVWLNPTARAKQIERETTARADAAKKAAEAKAAEVRKATAANVKVSPKSASAATPLGSMDDSLEATLAAIKARG